MESIKNPMVSVVVPVYNVERYVEESVRSVLGQTFKDFELIIVVDASPDRSLDICRKLADEDSRIKIFEHEHNQGLGPTRNTGLAHANGKYVFFLDSDDLMIPTALETFVKAAEANDAEVVHCTHFIERYEESPGKFKPEQVTRGDRKQVNGMLYLDRNRRLSERRNSVGGWMMVWLNLYRRDFLLQHDLRNPSMLSEDTPFNIALLSLADRYYCIPEALYIYNRRAGSIMKSDDRVKMHKWIASAVEGMRYVDEMLNRLPENILSSNVRVQCINYILRAILQHSLFRYFDRNSIQSADTFNAILDSIQPYFAQNPRGASRLLQLYVL